MKLTPAMFGLVATHKEHGRNFYMDQFGRYSFQPDAYQDHSGPERKRMSQWVMRDRCKSYPANTEYFASLDTALAVLAKRLTGGTMSRTEINVHPTVAPLLKAWREARADRDRKTADGRFGVATVRAAEAATRDAEKQYDAAVAALLKGTGR